jgi:hypothetical protein
MPVILLHLMNDDPILCEIDSLPTPTDVIVVVKNPRRRDGKDIAYIDSTVTSVVFPMHRVSFIEVMMTEEEEDIITHVRE